MSDKICAKCNCKFSKTKILDGKRIYLYRRKYCLNCVPYKDRSKLSKGLNYITKNYSKISDFDFLEAVKSSFSVREVLIKLNLVAAGGNYRSFYARVDRQKLDLSHFTGSTSNKGQKVGPKRPIEDYLSNKKSIDSFKLKKKLIEEDLKEHKCEKCNNTHWLNCSIPIELHHIDGNSKNNNLKNLQILCPNCHAQTSNYRGKNKK